MARSKKVTKRKTTVSHYRGPPESVKDKLPSSKPPKKKIKFKGKTRYA